MGGERGWDGGNFETPRLYFAGFSVDSPLTCLSYIFNIPFPSRDVAFRLRLGPPDVALVVSFPCSRSVCLGGNRPCSRLAGITPAQNCKSINDALKWLAITFIHLETHLFCGFCIGLFEYPVRSWVALVRVGRRVVLVVSVDRIGIFFLLMTTLRLVRHGAQS